MKLRTTIIATILLALIMSASPMGYCFTNTIAQKATDDVSDYQTMTQIGIAPGGEITISGGTILGMGVIAGLGAGLGTYYIIQASGLTLPTTAVIPVQHILGVGPTIAGLDYVLDAATGEYVGTVMVTTTIPAVISSPYAIPIAIAAGATIVVILVTATGVYLWWSAT